MDLSRRLMLSDFDPMRTRSDDAAVKEGYVWVPEKAERVQRFIETHCRLYVGRWAGQLIELMPFQQDLIWRLYGWVHKDTGLRRFRECYFESGKKNGKSPLVAALALYHLIADGENGPEIYINAAAREQAMIIYRNVQQMISQERQFDGLFHTIDSQKRILYPNKNGVLVANSAEASTKHGLQSSLTIFDELFEQPNRELWDAFAYAGRSRTQPLLLSITNAGQPDNEHPCYLQHKRALAVEEGSRTDVRFLGIVHGPRGPNPDIEDRRVWRMANPAMGWIVQEEDIAAELQKAQDEGPAALAKFKQLGLGIWEKSLAKWIDMGAWNAQDRTRTDAEIDAAGDVWAAGLDMSEGGDLTAYVRIAGNLRDGIDVRAHFWIPESTALKRQREEGIAYLEFAERGLVTLVPGDEIDPWVVRDYILNDFERMGGRLGRLHTDFFRTRWISEDLIAKGIDVNYMKPLAADFGPAIVWTQSLITRRKCRHDHHPLMAYCLGNAIVKETTAGNKYLVKPSNWDRIDGAIGLVESVAALADLTGYDGEGGEAAKPKYDENPKIVWLKL